MGSIARSRSGVIDGAYWHMIHRDGTSPEQPSGMPLPDGTSRGGTRRGKSVRPTRKVYSPGTVRLSCTIYTAIWGYDTSP